MFRDLASRGPTILVGCVAVGALLIAAAVQSPLLAVLCLGAVALGLLVILYGIEGTATGVIWLALFAAPLNAVRPTSAASFVTAADLLFVLGFLLLAPTLVPRTLRIPPLWGLGVLIMVAMGLFASLASNNPGLSLNHMMRFMVAAVFLPLAFMYWLPSRRVVGHLATAYLAGTFVSVLHAVATGPEATTGRYDGLTTHFNFFGLTGLLALAVTPYVASMVPRRLRWAAWLGGFVAFYGVWLSGSRAALLVAVVLAVAYPVYEKSLRAAAVLFAGGILALALSSRLSDSSGSNALSRLLGGGGADYADKAREEALQLALRMFDDHPLLGNGFELALEAHNIYLEIAVAVGVIGLFGYLLIFWTMVSPMFTARRPDFRLAYPALAYAMVGMITNALWDRFIWALLSLSLLVTLFPPRDEPEAETDGELDRWQFEDHSQAEERV